VAHSFAEHTGEIELHVSGPHLASVLEDAGRALAELLIGELPSRLRESESEPEWEPVDVRSAAPDSLIVDWLNELIYRSETHKRVYDRFRLEIVGDRAVRGSIQGFPADELRTQVKAATLHRLRVEPRPEGVHATVVLDV
jgi:SHS2 domain-containing protein